MKFLSKNKETSANHEINDASICVNEKVNRVDLIQPELQTIISETMSKVRILYSSFKIWRKYIIEDAPEELKQEWKRNIDILIEAIKMGEKKVQIMGKMINISLYKEIVNRIESLDEEDEKSLKLLAISVFVTRTKAKWNAKTSNWRTVVSGVYNLADLFDKTKSPTCYDTAVGVQALAEMYDISGKVRGKWLAHTYFEADSGQVSDPNYAKQNGAGGYFQTKEEYKSLLKEMPFCERRGCREPERQKKAA